MAKLITYIRKHKIDEMDHLIEAMERKDVKVTFGLQPHHIEKIEAEIKRWNAIDDSLGSLKKVDPKYIRYFWLKLGKEFAWEPLTLALYYFEYLEEQKV